MMAGLCAWQLRTWRLQDDGALVQRCRVAGIKGEEMGDGTGEDEEVREWEVEALAGEGERRCGRASSFLCLPDDLDYNDGCREVSH